MKLTSSSFRNNEPVPGRCAFGVPDVGEHMTFGQNRNPQLAWADIPRGAKSLVLLCIDPDVPSSLENFNKEGKVIETTLPRVEFCHWAMVDIAPRDGGVAEGECSDGITTRGKKNPKGPQGSRQGVNDYTPFMAGNADMAGEYYGYDGPCPPWNDESIHHYHFTLYATDLERCPVLDRFTGPEVLKAIKGHVLGEAKLTGTYTLNQKFL